jgi:hypothetical protein
MPLKEEIIMSNFISYIITSLILNSLQISGNAEGIGILLNILPGYEYENGKRTDTQTFLKYQVVYPDKRFEKVTVKVPGTKPVVTEEQLEQQNGKIKVRFKNLTGKIYRSNSGDLMLSCKADGVEVIV